MPKPIATWNPVRDVWETAQQSLLCEHSAVWSETFPRWGSWDAGGLYAHPTSAPRTSASAYSSLLPTPTASEATGPGYTDRANGGGRNLRTEIADLNR